MIFALYGAKIKAYRRSRRIVDILMPPARRKEFSMGLWTLSHLYQIAPTFLILGVLAVLAAKLFKNSPVSTKYIPLQVIAVLLIVLEIGKQISAAKGGSYDLYALPFHFCSLFLFLLPFHAFYHGKYSYITDTAAFACLASLMLDMLLMPAVIYSASNIQNFFNGYRDFHTVAFHNLVIFYFMLTVAFKLYDFKPKRDAKIMSIFFGAYVVVASILAYSLKVNFHNLYRCNIAFLEEVRANIVEAIGVFGSILYVCIMFVLTILFTWGSYFLARFVIGSFTKQKSPVPEEQTTA